jgi:myo-inositol-1(or 4)-monophosphatase
MNLKQIEERAIEIAREAGAFLRQGFREAKKIEAKSSAIDLVTQYDRESEALITTRIQEQFPGHHLFAEEGDYVNGSPSPFTWYIDPIDGTNNFAHGHPVFVVSLALYRDDVPLVGVIYDPMRDELFHGVQAGGAFVTDGRGNCQRLAVSETQEMVGALLATGFPYDRHTAIHNNIPQFAAFLGRAQGIRRQGAAALDMAYVAAGRLDGYWEFKLNSWDVAAGVLLVQEAGGSVSDVSGASFRLQRMVDLIASNGHLHEAMADVLASVPVADGSG